MLYTKMICIESCPGDKGRIHLVCPETAVHFILSGKGTYNGQTLTAGDGFVSILGDLVDYAPEPE